MADGSVKIDITADSGDARKELNKIEGDAKEAAEGLEDLGDSGEEAEKGIDALDVAAGAFVTGALAALIAGIGAAVISILELADATREYREDMAKLETAFTTAGFSTEAASSAYEDFYAILGESDRSVEAVNHLAELTNNEKELAQWSDICAGVTAKFGDSLPIEGLTEAANETAKVGAVTGPLADALNWAGISEDEFNEKLAACNSEQERATLITETLNGLYAEAAAEYNELTASTQEARRATSELEGAQADLGATVEPVTTVFTQFKANALEALLPVVQTCVDKFFELTNWMQENPAIMNVVIGVVLALTAGFVALGIALGIAPIIDAVKTAVMGLNAALAANPIGIVIAVITALVAAFLYFWNTSEAFREFWIGLWESIATACAPVVEAIKQWLSEAWDWIKLKWDEAQPYFAAIWEGIQTVFAVAQEWLPVVFENAWLAIQAIWNIAVAWFGVIWAGISGVFSVAVAFFGGLFSSAWAAITAVWNIVTSYFAAIWATIEGIFAVVEAVLSGDFAGAWAAIQGIVGTWAQFFKVVWDNIKNVFSNVASWFGETFSAAKEAISNIWDKVSEYFATVKENILGVFDSITSDFSGVGSAIIDGIWAGLSAGWDWLKGKVSELASGLLKAAKSVLDINSPSKKFAWIGEMSAEGVSVGFDKVNLPEDISDKLKGLTARVQTTVGAENVRMAQGVGTADTGFYDLARAVGIQTAGINSLAGEFHRGTGSTKPIIIKLNDRELGRAVVDVGNAEQNRVGALVY